MTPGQTRQAMASRRFSRCMHWHPAAYSDLDWGRADRKPLFRKHITILFFAIICEELGIVGAALVILLFCGAYLARDSHCDECKGQLWDAGCNGDYGGYRLPVDYQYRRCNEYDSKYGAAAAVLSATAVPRCCFLMAMVGMLLNISRYPKDREN